MSFSIPYGSGGGLLKPAPNLNFLLNRTSTTYTTINGISVNGSTFSTALNLNGKNAVTFLQLVSISSGNLSVRLTIDGTIIWDTTVANGTSYTIYGSNSYDVPTLYCENNLLLEIKLTAGTTASLRYIHLPLE